MTRRALSLAPLALVLVLPLLLARAEDERRAASFPFKDGDVVLFYGDSITDQRLYTTFVETWAVTRFPDRKVRFVHKGWGGDRADWSPGGPVELRVRRDVAPFKPTVVTIMLGMNDAGYQSFDEGHFGRYRTYYPRLIDAIRAASPGVRLTLLDPSPYDDVNHAPQAHIPGGYNAVLGRFADYVHELATEKGADVASVNTPVVAWLERAKNLDADTARRVMGDRVHPHASGHLLIAQALLQAWSAPSVVSEVELDASSGKLVRSTNTKVSDLRNDASGLSWTQEDGALPLALNPKDAELALVARASGFHDVLNRQMLVAKGLRGPRCVLEVDGRAVATLGPEKLADGINLAELATPMVEQSLVVHALTLKHGELHFLRWRHVQVPLQDDALPSLGKALAALDALEAEIVEKQRAAAKPKPHAFKLIVAR